MCDSQNIREPFLGVSIQAHFHQWPEDVCILEFINEGLSIRNA